MKIEATPISGYKFVKAMLDGKDITGNTFKINQYGVLAAVFDVDNDIHNAQAEAVKVVRHNGNIVVMGLHLASFLAQGLPMQTVKLPYLCQQDTLL